VGVDVCEGNPCFKGVRIGMDWAQAENAFPYATMQDSYLHIPSNIEGTRIGIFPSKNGKSVYAISFEMQTESGAGLPFKADEVIAQYGMPCRVYLEYGDSYPGNMIIIYPTMTVRFNLQVKNPDDSYDYRLQMDTPVLDFTMVENGDSWTTCEGIATQQFGPWHGFTSANRYLTYNLNDLAAYQRADNNH